MVIYMVREGEIQSLHLLLVLNLANIFIMFFMFFIQFDLDNVGHPPSPCRDLKSAYQKALFFLHTKTLWFLLK